MASTLPDLTEEPTYQALKSYFEENGKQLSMRKLFESDSERFKKFRYYWFIN